MYENDTKVEVENFEVRQQRYDLQDVARYVQVQKDVEFHVNGLDSAIQQIKEGAIFAGVTSAPLLPGAMPEWYEEAARISKDYLDMALSLMESIRDRLARDYLGA